MEKKVAQRKSTSTIRKTIQNICLTTNDVISRISLTDKLLSFYYSFTIDMISMGKIIIHKHDVMQNSFPN